MIELFKSADGENILKQIIEFNDNPIYKGSAEDFKEYNVEDVKKEFEHFEKMLREQNPELSHLSNKELAKLTMGLSDAPKKDILKKLELGTEYDKNKYSISNHINTDLFDLMELLFVKYDDGINNSDKKWFFDNFKNHEKGQDSVADEKIEYMKRLLKSETHFWQIQRASYLNYRNENDAKMHEELLADAFANRDLLKSGLEDLSDKDVKGLIETPNVAASLRLLGKGNLEAAFPLTEDGFAQVVEELAEFNPSKENREKLLQKINPTESDKYKRISSEITELKNKLKDLQKAGDFDKNSSHVRDIFSQISTKSKELKEFVNEYSDIQPQEVLDKVRMLAVIDSVFPNETERFIDLIKPSTPENDANWERNTNEAIYKLIGVEADEKLNEKLNLAHCKYLSKLAISMKKGRSFMEHSDKPFSDYMKKLVLLLKKNPNLTVEETIDSLPQNKMTKEKFTEIGLDFEKWTQNNPNSFVDVQVELDAEQSKKAAISNLEEDLNDPLLKKLPQDVQNQIFEALNSIGVTFEKSQKDDFDSNGFSDGQREFNRLYKDGKPIEFKDLKKIVSKIKETINKNEFWTKKCDDKELDTARSTIYEHLIKLRKTDVNNARSLKDSETVNLRISKTNMYDISKAIGLGNDGQCCTALGSKFNEYSAPTYIMNKCIGAIELTDGRNFVGNTMMYIAEVDGEPALVLDNIELKSKYQNNDKIRDAFMDYAKKLCEEIGKPDLPIYAGPNRHKLTMSVYPKTEHSMKIIGYTGEDEIYIDYDAEPHVLNDENEADTIEMYKIR